MVSWRHADESLYHARKYLMDHRTATRPLRWFLLFWVGLVYVWGLLALEGVNPKVMSVVAQGDISPNLLSALFFGLPASPMTIALFTGLVLLYGILLWMGLSDMIAPRFHWPYFLGQGVLVLVIGFVIQQENVVLSLYLALTLGAISMLQRVWPVTLVASGSLVLFLVSSLWSVWPQQQHWQMVLLILWTKTDYPTLLLFAVGYVVLYIQQNRIHTQLASTHAALETAHAQLKASAERIEALTLLTERQRMARELHDTLAQDVAGLIMQLEAAKAQLSQRRLESVEGILQQAMSSARTTLADARGVIDDLRTITSFEEFANSVHEEISRFRSATGIAGTSDLTALSLVPAPFYEQVFHTIRESLANVARHAQATQAWVRVRACGQALAIEVQDNGLGFEPGCATTWNGHYGLLGMRERARLAGGTLAVESLPGAGTTIRLQIPGGPERSLAL
jgi:NarL family two-component system sensor histidine kinase YdfH